LIFINTVREKLKTLEPETFYSSTKRETRDEIVRIAVFLEKGQVDRLERLWSEYEKLSREELDDEKEIEGLEELYKISGEEFKKPSEILRYYLGECYKAAK
jgi:hypothetical protein